ncbi:hypothetical protein [Pseudomonas sp. 43(2021)]|uniref:hypothetical protein n=1 Tax=Pseudomonas sp. 43(2021) TaxID=2813560 RepID=UPI001A9CDD30|nr:hypothetical protein [Pseudomonas sp. 43(2021)]
MATSAFGDEIPDDPVAPGPAARQPQPAPAQPQVSAFGDPLSAFGDALDDEPAQPVQPAPAQPVPGGELPNRTAGQWATDVGAHIGRGAYGLFDTLAGVGDLATGGAVTPWLQSHGLDSQKARAALDAEMSPQALAQRKEVEDAQGFAGTAGAVLRNPAYAAGAIIESVPQMVAGGVAGRGIAAGARLAGAAPGLAGALGTGAGEGLAAAGQQAAQTVQRTGDLTPGQTGLALLSGGMTGLLGAAGARVGRALGIGDVDSMLAGQGGADVAKSLVNRALAGTGIESLEELSQSAQQQVLTNLATGRPAMEGVANAAGQGAVLGGVMGGGVNLASRPTVNTPAEQPAVPPAPQVDPVVAAARAAVPGAIQRYLNPEQATPAPAAPPTPPRPAPQPAPQPVPFAGSQNVRPLFESMGLDQQQMDSSLALLADDEPNIEAARRGKMTWEETSQLADLAGTSIAKMRARRLGQPLNAEDHLAATRFLKQQTTRTLELANQMSELTNAGKTDDVLAADFMTALNDLRTVQGAVMGSRAELGRALAIQRMNVQTGKQAAALLDSVGGMESAKDMAKALTTAARTGGVKAANKLASKAGSDWFWTYYKAALLSGPDTHIVNSASNLANAVLNIPTRAVAGGIGSAKRAVGLQGETRMAEPAYQLRGFVDGISSGAKAFADSWQGRETEYEASSNAKNDVYRSDLLGQKYWGVPLRALGAADAFFKAVNAGMETYSLAYRTAASEGLEGDALGARVKELVANPTEKMKAGVKASAEFQTFTDKSGAVINMLNLAKNKVPLGLGNLPMTFVKTPGKVAAYSVKHTPLLTYAFKDSRDAFKAGGAAHEQVLARQAVGSLIMSLGALGSAAGVLTGNGPNDDGQRRAWLAAGNQPYSLKINGQWYSYQRIEPFSTLLGISADVAQNYRAGDSGGAALTKAIGNNLMNKTFLKGLTSMIQALADPDRYGASWANSTAATLIDPWTIGAHVGRAMDPYQRETDRDSFTDQLKYRLPFARETLPIRRDQFGAAQMEPQRQFGRVGPIPSTVPSDDPLRQEAARLGWAPQAMKRTFSLKSQVHGQRNQKVELTTEQLNELNELAGSRMHADASALMRSKAWQAMDDDERVDALDKVMSAARRSAKQAFTPYLRNGSRGAINLHRQQTAAKARSKK